MDTSIVIPNYNGEELLKKNLPSVLEAVKHHINNTGQEVEVIVVDDESIDKSKAFIKSQISNLKSQKIQLKLIENEKNLGFASAVNIGVGAAKGEVVVLLNTDVAPQEDFLSPLLLHFEDQKVFAVGCMDKSIEGGKVVLRGRGIGKWERGFFVHARGEIDKTNTLWVNGGSGAFRKSIWDKLGGFNKLYTPFYWEDIDLSYRALKSGYKIFFEPKSVVVHEHERGAIKKKYSSLQIKTIAYRNQFIFVWENATDLDLQFLHIFWLPYHFLKMFLNRDWAFFVGFFQSFIRLPKVIQTSFKAQKLFIKSDKEVIKEFRS